MATSIGNFLQLFDIKLVISGLNTSNTLSSYSLRPFFANLVTFIILLLSATLTQFETSVPPPPKKKQHTHTWSFPRSSVSSLTLSFPYFFRVANITKLHIKVHKMIHVNPMICFPKSDQGSGVAIFSVNMPPST